MTSHAAAIKTIREAADHRRAPVAIIQDLQGPRIRVGEIAEGGIVLRGQPVRATADDVGAIRRTTRPSIDFVLPAFRKFPSPISTWRRDVRPGARILINDGLIELAVEQISGGPSDCHVVVGGTVTSHKGINLPGTRVSAPTLTDKDREDIRFGVEQGVDYVALSFVRGAGRSSCCKNTHRGMRRQHPGYCENRTAGGHHLP